MTVNLEASGHCSLMRDPEPEPFSKAVPGFLIQGNCEIISVRCFKLLDLGVICYTATGN